MMFARLILVTHSSSLRMVEGMFWRHTCRGSMFLVTKGMMESVGQWVGPTLIGETSQAANVIVHLRYKCSMIWRLYDSTEELM